MAADKFQILIETKHIGNKEIANLLKQFEALGGTKTLQAQKAINKLNKDISALNGGVQKSKPIFGRFAQGIALGNIAAIAATKAVGALKDGMQELGKAVLVAARVEVMRTVLTQMGKTAKISDARLRGLTMQIKALGITEHDAIAIQQRFIQANLDVADALKIARLAQDAAVVAGVNSSEAALQITDAINKQRPILLKQFGIMVNLTTLYKNYAKELGKTTDELTANEKKQALLNEVLVQGKTISGNYLAAMGDVGKQMTSLPRIYDDAQVAVGERFLPVLQVGVDTAKDFLVAIKNMAQGTVDSAAEFLAQKLNVEKSNERIGEAVDRYEELASQQSLTNTEQEEFNTLLANLVQRFPDAITQWNEYGKAVDVSTSKIRTQIRVQEDLQKAKLLVHLREVSDEFQELQDDLDLIKKRTADLAGPGLSDLMVALGKSALFISDMEFETASWTGGMGKTQEQVNELVAALASQILAFKDQESIMKTIIEVSPELGNAIRAYIGDVEGQEKAWKDAADAATEAALEIYVKIPEMIKEMPPLDFTIDSEGLLKASEDLGADLVDDWEETNSTIQATAGTTAAKISNSYKVGTFAMRAGYSGLAAGMTGAMSGAASRIVGSLKFLHTESTGVFKNMAADFMRFFVQEILRQVQKLLVTKLLKILGGIFDTAANDRMAAAQGADFAKYFTAGMMNTLTKANLGPQMVGAVGGGSTTNTTMNLNFMGPVTNADFIREEILPILEDASRNALTDLVIDETEITGARDVT